MPVLSVTRLRLRSVRFVPRFAWLTLRSRHQLRRAPGFRAGALLADRRWAFWTMTAWETQDDLRRYITTSAHRVAMPRLVEWCDEASVVHWTQADDTLPSWQDADRRMREDGRPSKVRNPSPDHAALTYGVPRTAGTAPIGPAPRPIGPAPRSG